MKPKQILLVAGGTALGAIAAVALMKAMPSGSDRDPDPAPVSQSTTEDATERSKANPRNPALDSEAEPLSEGTAGNGTEIDEKELDQRREELRETMKERQMERLTNKMAKWSAALGLDKGQQEKLLEIAGAQFDELEALATAGEGDDPAAASEAAKRAMAIISGRALEEAMVEGLTPAQQESYKQFDTRQNASRAEARSLRQLATLQEDLMLTPQQRNDVYGILYEDSVKQVEGDSDVTSVIDEVASQAGVSLDPSMQGIIASLANRGLAEMASGRQLDEESIRTMAEETFSGSIDEQVGKLAPVLTEAQLELYRSQLEGRLSNITDMIEGAPGGE